MRTGARRHQEAISLIQMRHNGRSEDQWSDSGWFWNRDVNSRYERKLFCDRTIRMMVLPFIQVEKNYSRIKLGGEHQECILNMLHLRCIYNPQMEMPTLCLLVYFVCVSLEIRENSGLDRYV